MIVKAIFSLPPREKMGQTHPSGDYVARNNNIST
jgi:hypothetical protein